MTSIVSYRKHTDPHTTYLLRTPDGDDSTGLYCTELCTLDGVTYVAVPEGVALPEQPAEITGSVAVVALTPELRERIKAESTHCQLIAERVEQKIRARYALSDEQYFARIASGVALGLYQFEAGEAEALQAFGEHVEACRAWGRAERARLGL